MCSGRKRGARSILFALGIGVGLPIFSARGQLVADGATNVLNAVTTNIIAAITVGSNGPFTRLIVTNGAVISNTGGVSIGLSANSNALVVTGPGSRWNSSAGLTVGESGAYNQLSILDGAVFSSSGAMLGYLGNSGSNLVLVSGAGSLWTNRGSLNYGKGGGNQLVISNGGSVFNYEVSMWNAGRISVSGTGSVWNSASLSLRDSFEQVSVSDGGAVTNTGSCTIGELFSHSNSVLVIDPGSVMRISASLSLASGGIGNQFMVSNGAAVTVGNSTFIASTNQRLTIIGTASQLTSQNDFYLGQSGYSNSLSVRDGGMLADNSGYVGYIAAFNNALVSGTHTLWTNSATLYVGYSSARNQLVISNGATVCDTNGILGYNSNTYSNTVVVTGPGSLWTNSSALTIGTNGSFNQLFITNGGSVYSGTTYIGSGVSSFSNRVILADAGSVLTTSNLFIGFPSRFTKGNQLTVGTGAVVTANSLTICSSDVPLGNSLIINGGSVIITNSLLSGILLITNFGTVTLTSGSLRADYLNLGRSPSVLNFSGGTLQTAGSASQTTETIGNGNAQATFELLGGTHNFALGLVISSNAVLKGLGIIAGNVMINPGGTLSPSPSISQVTLNGRLLLSPGSSNIMELKANDGACDSIAGPSNLVYGGTLILTNLAGVLTNGSSFRLFSASNYSGAFSAILPSSPGPGLKWNTNELAVDGVLRVFSLQSPAPVLSGVQASGTNIQISASGGIPYNSCYLLTTTNIGSPAAWEYLGTNRFDPAGNAIFSPPFSAAEPVRFFRLQAE